MHVHAMSASASSRRAAGDDIILKIRPQIFIFDKLASAGICKCSMLQCAHFFYTA